MGGNSPILKRYHNGALEITSGAADGQTEIPIRRKNRSGEETLIKQNCASCEGLDETEGEGLKREGGDTRERDVLGKEEKKEEKLEKSRRLKGKFLLWVMMTSPTLTLTLTLIAGTASGTITAGIGTIFGAILNHSTSGQSENEVNKAIKNALKPYAEVEYVDDEIRKIKNNYATKSSVAACATKTGTET